MESNLLNQCREYLDFEEHPQFRQELQTLIDNKDEKGIRDRFYTQLAFGTGGLRGVIGAGYNRMNPYMVKRATQGLANYILKQNFEKPSAVIAYDSRNFSPEFSESAALVLCANNIRAFLFLPEGFNLCFEFQHTGLEATKKIHHHFSLRFSIMLKQKI